MDLHAVWNRMDQLERLVKSQAREINHLKHVVNSTRIPLASATDIISQTSPLKFNNFDNHQQPNKNNSLLQSHHEQHHHLPLPQNNKKSLDRNSVTLTFHPYAMNPIVHPTSAIPLINTQPLLDNSDSTKERPLSNTTPSTYTHNLTTSPSKLLDNRTSLAITNGDSHFTTPIALDQESLEEDSFNHLNGRHERQSFVEHTALTAAPATAASPQTPGMPLTPPQSQSEDDSSPSSTKFLVRESNSLAKTTTLIDLDSLGRKLDTQVPLQSSSPCSILASRQADPSPNDDLTTYCIGDVVAPTPLEETKLTANYEPLPILIEIGANKKFRTVPIVHELRAKKLKIDNWSTLKLT